MGSTFRLRRQSLTPGSEDPHRDLLLRAGVLGILGLFLIAAMTVLGYAKDVFVPVAVATLLSFVLMPSVRRLARLGVPKGVGALLVVVILLAAGLTVVFRLAEPAAQWAARAPQDMVELREKLTVFAEPIEKVQEASKEVEEATAMENDADEAPEVKVKGPSLAERFFASGGKTAVGVGLTAVLLYFFLSFGDGLMRNVSRVLYRKGKRRQFLKITQQAQSDLSAYFGTIALINLGLGAATAGAMAVLGLPNALLWGAVATVMNFIPYLGALVTASAIAVAAVLAFQLTVHMVLPPLVFLSLTILEGQVVTPMILSRRLSLNPIATMLALVIWGWLWGIAGVLLAVPLLAATKIICDHTVALKPLGRLLGWRKAGRRRQRRATPLSSGAKS